MSDPSSPSPEQQPAPYGQQPYAGPPYPQQRLPNGLTHDEVTWGGVAHWSALVAAFVAMAFLGPLIVFLIKGNDSAYVRAQSAESLNFQLSMLIYGVVGGIVGVLVSILTLGLGLFVFIPLILVFGVLWLVFTIIGSVKSVNGEMYRYPLTIRMVS
jgi:uncharacterized Tic20 family protein